MTEALKYDPMADAHYSKRRKTNTASPTKASVKKRLAFQETVQVVPIPMRNEYSSRVRSRLWTNAAELYENAARNTLEFAYEGYVHPVLLSLVVRTNLVSQSTKPALILSMLAGGTGAKSPKTNACMFALLLGNLYIPATMTCSAEISPTNSYHLSCPHYSFIHSLAPSSLLLLFDSFHAQMHISSSHITLQSTRLTTYFHRHTLQQCTHSPFGDDPFSFLLSHMLNTKNLARHDSPGTT
jgi:hypothetical protein